MVELLELWLPIVLSAVIVFVASSVIHMATPMHKSDMKALPGEQQVLAALRAQATPPGEYFFPFASSMKEYGSPEHVEKMKRGPVGSMVLQRSAPPSMGRALGQWFVYCLLVGVFCAYVATLALPRGAEYIKVFQLTGAVALLGHGFTSVQGSIWKGVSWGTTLRFFVDGLIYSLLVAGSFAGFWPAS